jgi:hypothetical protein
LAPAVIDSVVAPNLISFAPPNFCPSSTDNRWFIGVIVLACVLAIVLLILFIYLFRRQRREKERIIAVMNEKSQEKSQIAAGLGNQQCETSLPLQPVEADGKDRRDSVWAAVTRTFSRRSSTFSRGMSVTTAVSPDGHSPAELGAHNQKRDDSAHNEPMV